LITRGQQVDHLADACRAAVSVGLSCDRKADDHAVAAVGCGGRCRPHDDRPDRGLGTDQVPVESSTRHLLLAVVTAVATGSLAFRRRAPFAVVVVAMTAITCGARIVGPGTNTISLLFAGLLAIYTAGSLMAPRRAASALAVSVVLAAIASADAADWTFATVMFAGAWLAGRAVDRHRQLATQLIEANAQLQRDAHLREELAAADERARIAREVHDVLAHTVSVMVVQAEAAEEPLDHDIVRTQRAIVAIQDTGREALDEMRHLLAVLRKETDDHGLQPQPGLGRVPTLITELQHAGLDTEFTINGDCRALPPGIELCAYRVVQEALTNILQHSTARQATVVVTFREHDLSVDVTDDGNAVTANHDGHGLVGIRERIAMYGGTSRIGPRPAGGFEVACSIPYPRTSS
jgi:signal transduction histidine kinase